MQTRAQANRDAALRRLTRLNRSLAVTAAVGTALVTDVVANTASGHTRKPIDSSRRRPKRSVKLASAGTHHGVAHKRAASSTAGKSTESSSTPSTATPSQSSPSVSAASSTQPAVVVSGGS